MTTQSNTSIYKPNNRTYSELPRVGVGILVFREEHILLVKRGQPPSEGKWTIPGGLVELGETLQQAAERELLEECGISIELGDIIYTFDFIERDEEGRIKYHYVIIDFAATFRDGNLKASSDIEDAAWVSPNEINNFDVPERTKKLIMEVVQGKN